MDTIEISNITAEWLDANLPDLMAGVRAAAREGTFARTDHEAALSAARETATTEATTAATAAERARVIGIQEAAKGMGLAKLVAELVGDSKITVDAAKARLFEALQAARKGGLDALAQDEAELDAPSADSGNEDAASTTAAQIKAANDYAFRHAARR